MTSDILEVFAAELLRLYWDVRTIEHVEVNQALKSRCKNKFTRVFTKLRAWELNDFRKVVLLDTDILVRRNVDELFDLPTPTAPMRGHLAHEPGKLRPGKSLYDNTTRLQKFGINAGVIVLSPDSQVFDRMVEHLLRSHPGAHNATTAPEQDFLSA